MLNSFYNLKFSVSYLKLIFIMNKYSIELLKICKISYIFIYGSKGFQ